MHLGLRQESLNFRRNQGWEDWLAWMSGGTGGIDIQVVAKKGAFGKSI